jgi:hypothetical protein
MGFPAKSNQNKPSSKGMPSVPKNVRSSKLPAKTPQPVYKKAGK